MTLGFPPATLDLGIWAAGTSPWCGHTFQAGILPPTTPLTHGLKTLEVHGDPQTHPHSPLLTNRLGDALQRKRVWTEREGGVGTAASTRGLGTGCLTDLFQVPVSRQWLPQGINAVSTRRH